MEDSNSKQKIIMVVNGQPIEMCLKTLKLCNKRSQNLITSLKRKSLEQAHTMRLFWGDIIMLNIITNQMLQKVDSKSLSRILKPVESLQADLDEYRETRNDVAGKLKDVLIIARNDTLPLDYSHELEKYYKSKFKSESEEDEFSSIIDAAVEGMKALDAKNALAEQSVENKNINEQIDNEESIVSFEDSAVDSNDNDNSGNTAVLGNTNPSSELHRSKEFVYTDRKIYREDENEQTVDFSSFFTSKTIDDEKTKPPITPFNKENNEKKESNVQTESSRPAKGKKSTRRPLDNKTKKNNATNDIDLTSSVVQKEEKNKTVPQSPVNKKQDIPNETKIPNAQEELKKTEEAFASYGSLDLSSLFE